MDAKNIACSACYGSGYGVDEKPCTCGCRPGWSPAIAPPVAAGSVDTCAEMRALCSACGGTGDVHSIDGEWRGQCTCVHAWQMRAEKAEARVKELEWHLDESVDE